MINSDKQTKQLKLIICLLIVVVGIFLYLTIPEQYVSLHYLQSSLEYFRSLYRANPAAILALYFLAYLITCIFALPVATFLTLLAGATFGFTVGFFMTMISSTVGATVTMLISRFVLYDFIRSLYPDKAAVFDRQFEKNGNSYLWSMRLIPVFPFFMINLLMGITKIKIRDYFLISAVAMMPGELAYIYAGVNMAKLTSLQSVLNFEILISLSLLGLLPFIGKFIFNIYNTYKLYRNFKKPSRFDYNIIVIGGGSAGLVSANIGATLGAKVLLIEKDRMGGDCLNTGCVPSKALITASKKYKTVNEIKNYIDAAILKIAPNDSVERYRSLGVDCLKGEALLTSPWEVLVDGQTYSAKKIIIASGAKPFVPEIPGLNEIPFKTTENLWDLNSIPEKLLIVGGGAIGIELSQAFARLGSEVIIIEQSSRLLAKEEVMTSEVIEAALKKSRVTIFTDTTITRFFKENGTHSVEVKVADKNRKIDFDEVLIASGRMADTECCRKLNIELNEKGAVKINSAGETSFKNIYACGDVTGQLQFTHFASFQAKHVVLNALFSPFKKFKMDAGAIPRCLYCDPEVAAAGKTSLQLLSEGIAFDQSLFPIAELDRAIIEQQSEGFVMILTAKNKSKILGVTIVAPNASLLIQEFVLAMENKLNLNKILNSTHPYPSWNEANKYAAGVWKRSQFHPKLRKLLKSYLELRL